MAALDVPEMASFWVGGKEGRLLHGDVGAIGARIERMLFGAKALGVEPVEVASLLGTDAAPRDEPGDDLREQFGRMRGGRGCLRRTLDGSRLGRLGR